MSESSGVYVLVLHAAGPVAISIDRGRRDLPAGWYAYVGADRLTGGAPGWVRRAVPPGKTPHALIDRLRAVTAADEVWYAEGQGGLEPFWRVQMSRLPGAEWPIPGFGVRDYRAGATPRLFRFPAKPSAAAFRAQARLDAWDAVLVDFVAGPAEALARLGAGASPNVLSYERGRRYLEERRRTAAASEGTDDPVEAWGSPTAFAEDRAGSVLATGLAADYGLPAAEYEAEARFAEAAEKVVATCGPKALPLLLGRLTPDWVVALAEQDDEAQRREIAALAAGGQQP